MKRLKRKKKRKGRRKITKQAACYKREYSATHTVTVVKRNEHNKKHINKTLSETQYKPGILNLDLTIKTALQNKHSHLHFTCKPTKLLREFKPSPKYAFLQVIFK